MKKLLIFLFLFLFIFKPFNVNANVDVTIEVDRNVEGVTYSDLSNQFVELELSDPDFAFEVSEGEDITAWFTNIPSGLNATVEEVDNEYLKVRFEGQTTEPKDEVILVSVPSGKISFMGSLIEGELSNDPDSEDSKYIITELEIKAYYNQPSTVSGYVGEELTVQYVYIKLENDTYSDQIINDVLSVYNGLTATVIDHDENNVALVKYTGTPLAEDDSLIHSTLKAKHLNICETDLIVPDREDVRFDIRIRSVVPDEPSDDSEPDTYTIPFTGIE